MTFFNISDSLPSLPWDYASHHANDWGTGVKIASLKVASLLTEPVCRVREYIYTFAILDATCQSTAQKVAKSAFLVLGIAAFGVLTPFTAPLGMALRGIVAALESKPYLYLANDQKGKILPPDKKFTVFSQNVCLMPAGYAITDGQVTPPCRERIDAIIRQIKTHNPDVVCLYEVADIWDTEYLSSRLFEYPFVIPVAGVRAIGPSSMMCVLSKYAIEPDSIEFSPFEKGVELTGRAQWSEKGILSFDIKSQSAPFATVISTHLQHSEIPAEPTQDEVKARALQMKRVAKKIEAKVALGRAVIAVGDMNLEESELACTDLRQMRRDPSVVGIPTWGGDGWCAKLMGKIASRPLVLDYALAAKVASIATQVLETAYSGLEFRPEATSDHKPLFSTITLDG